MENPVKSAFDRRGLRDVRINIPKGLPEPGRWHFMFHLTPDLMTRCRGWRIFTLGLFRIRKFPPDGERIQSRDYLGFLIEFRYWLPWERI